MSRAQTGQKVSQVILLGFYKGQTVGRMQQKVRDSSLNVGDRKTKPWLVCPRVFQGQKAGSKLGGSAWCMSFVGKFCVKSYQLSTGENSHWLVCWSGAISGGSEFCPKKSPRTRFYITDPELGAVRRQQNIFIGRQNIFATLFLLPAVLSQQRGNSCWAALKSASGDTWSMRLSCEWIMI